MLEISNDESITTNAVEEIVKLILEKARIGRKSIKITFHIDDKVVVQLRILGYHVEYVKTYRVLGVNYFFISWE